MAARCCCPPESWAGKAWRLSAIPTFSRKKFGRCNRIDLGLAEDAPRGFDDVVENTHVWPEVEALEHEAHACAQTIDLFCIGGNQSTIAARLELHFFAGDENLAFVRIFQQIDATQQRALAGT